MANDFWARKVGTPNPPQRQTVAPATNQAWWQPPQVVSPQQQQSNVATYNEADYHVQQAQRLARSARLDDRCPECNSGNYMPIGTQYSQNTGKVEKIYRCWDCGYPRLQEFSGAGMPSGQGEVVGSAKQLAAAHEGYHGNITSASQAVERIG